MITEAEFRKAINSEPDNWAMYLVFADWLEDRGDWRAAGYRWMGETKHRPLRAVSGFVWRDIQQTVSKLYRPNRLPTYIFLLLTKGIKDRNWIRTYHKSRYAEEDLCQAINKWMDQTKPLELMDLES